jgi:predicted nucleic acid-binding protein
VNTVKRCWDMRLKYRYNYWDCLILASALENDCGILYTEDLQHGQIIEKSLEIVNPFLS